MLEKSQYCSALVDRWEAADLALIYQGKLFTLVVAVTEAVAAVIAVKFFLLSNSKTYLIITL